MPVFVLAYDDDDMNGVLGVYASTGALINTFFNKYGVDKAEQRDILKEISESARVFDTALLPSSRAYFRHGHYNYSISEYRVKE